jgi:myo-inositol-1(or 4)-monophosphatase
MDPKILAKKYAVFALRLAKQAGAEVLHYWRKPGLVHYKNHRELVARADIKADRLIVKEISKHFPSHGIQSEESKPKNFGAPILWIIDPLDGTNNFVMGSPLFTVNVALAYRGEVILGVIYSPPTHDLYLTCKGGGAYLNGKRIRVSKVKKLKDAPIIFCHGYAPSHASLGSKIYSCVHPRALVCRMWGSAGVEFGAVAHGGVGAFIFTGSKIWDLAAGVLLVREAGGKVTDLNGKDLEVGKKPKGDVLIASNGLTHQELLHLIRRAI